MYVDTIMEKFKLNLSRYSFLWMLKSKHPRGVAPGTSTTVVGVYINLQVISWQSFYSFGQGIIIAATGFLVVFVSLHKVWGTWKLKREAGIQRGDDLVSILLKQGKFQDFYLKKMESLNRILQK